MLPALNFGKFDLIVLRRTLEGLKVDMVAEIDLGNVTVVRLLGVVVYNADTKSSMPPNECDESIVDWVRLGFVKRLCVLVASSNDNAMVDAEVMSC